MRHRHLSSHLTTWATAAVLLLAACGGGGGGGNATDPTAPNPPPPQQVLAGRLWHDNYALDFRDGTQTASPAGAPPAQITGSSSVTPWPDGRQYVDTDHDTYEETTRLLVVNVDSGLPVVDAVVPGYLSAPIPSLADKDIAAFSWAPDFLGDKVWYVVRLSTLQVLQELDANDALTWLPDGRWLTVSDDGRIRAGRLDTGEVSQLGRLAFPTGLSLGPVWANRQGDRLAMRLTRPDGASIDADIWVAAIDGSGLHALTDTHMSWGAHWSPDGRHVAFDVDTGYLCTGVGCIGSCELWYAPHQAVGVRALDAAPGEGRRFQVKNRRGSTMVLGCDLLAWTD